MAPVGVLFVFGTLGPGGAERQVLTLLRKLDRERWRPIVCAMRHGLLSEEFAAAAETHVVGTERRIDPARAWRMRTLLRDVRPSIVHTMMSTGNTWGRVAVSIAGAPWPVVVAEELNVDTWKSFAHRAVDRLLLRATDVMVGNAHAVTRYLVDHERVPTQIACTVPSAVDLERAQRHLGCTSRERTRWRDELGLSEDDYVVGHIGRPAVAKGLEVLADVVDRLRRVRPGVRLLRVGPPPQPMDVPFAEAFDRSIKERGIADIVVRQPFSEDISKVLSVMDVLVQTSHQEGLAGVVMEAMAMELPVVATAAGGTAEVIRHRETGWLVQPGDGDGLVEGLQHARDNAHAAQEWARAARELIETDYSDDAMVNRTVALYEHLLARRARGDV